MNIYLVRHGAVENPKNILYAKLPGFHLSHDGQEQMKALAKEFSKLRIEKIYSSSLERAIESAEILAEGIGLTKEEIIIEPGLIESEAGPLQGMSRQKFMENFNRIICNHEVEPIQKAGGRVLAVLKKIAQGNKDAIVVSHGDPIMGTLGLIINDWSIIECYIKKGSFAKIHIEGDNWQVSPFDEMVKLRV